MGYGDILMSMGEARVLHGHTRQPVLIVDRSGRPVLNHDLFKGVPYLLTAPTNERSYQRLVNGPGTRPYILTKTPRQWTWKRYRPVPAELQLTREEQDFAERYRGAVMVEPNIKGVGHENKAWAWDHWVQFAKLARADGIALVQCGPPDARVLPGAVFVATPSIRYAIAVQSLAAAFVGTEGGLMHAAAAVGTPAVILWSEFISPEITGYDTHRNLRIAGKACGMRIACAACRRAMDAITPSLVLDNLKELLNETR